MKNRDKLIEDNLGLIHWTIQMYIKVPPGMYDDCFQEGCLGLCMAVDKFDETRGVEFSTFAVPCILGSIRRFLREWHPLRTPREYHYLYPKIASMLEDGLSREEIIERLNISEYKYQQALNIYATISLDEPINDNGHLVADVVPDEVKSAELVEYEILDVVRDITSDCSTKDRDIYYESILSRLYLPKDEQPNQAHLAEKYGVSQPSVSRLIRKFDKLLKEKYYGM